MTNTTQKKLWTRRIHSLLALALIVGITGCNGTPNETWHCYDTQGHPAEGILIVCFYGLANYKQSGVNCRFSDATGKITLDLDKDTPHGLQRGYDCIYSAKLRSGAAGLGERWHDGQPVPDTAVYFDERNNKIFLKSGVDDPLIWHAALNNLISSYNRLRKFTNGGMKVNETLSTMVPRERTLFLDKYGELAVPLDYLNSASVKSYYSYLAKSNNATKTFRDITLPLPKP